MKKVPVAAKLRSRRFHPRPLLKAAEFPIDFVSFPFHATPDGLWCDLMTFFPVTLVDFSFLWAFHYTGGDDGVGKELECATRSVSKYHFWINNKICFRKWNVLVNLRSHVLMFSREKREVCDENLIKRLLLVCAWRFSEKREWNNIYLIIAHRIFVFSLANVGEWFNYSRGFGSRRLAIFLSACQSVYNECAVNPRTWNRWHTDFRFASVCSLLPAFVAVDWLCRHCQNFQLAISRCSRCCREKLFSILAPSWECRCPESWLDCRGDREVRGSGRG